MMAENWPAFGTRGLFGNVPHRGRLFGDLFSTSPWDAGLRSVARDTYPPMNITGSENAVDVYLFASGLDAESIDVSIRRNLLTVSAERQAPAEEEGSYYRRERFFGSFRRVVTLPEDVDPDQVEARYRNGVLHITVKRSEQAKPRQIEVH
ncbi:MAG: Hsp20/alpha crystallin family protein [Gammaproteobacteria bacterium]|nr:Hsp20/alpha crystallin family protein [Gammaproteobacteria bacterium]